jgi:hypothetical protein
MPANLLAELLMFASVAAGSLALLAAYERSKFVHERRAKEAYYHMIMRAPDEKIPVTIDREEARTLLRFIKIALDHGAAEEFLDEFSADVFVQRMIGRFRKIADAPRIPAAP